MRASAALRIAGYQGDGSILTASLRELAGLLAGAAGGLAVDMEADVTSAGERAVSLFASVERGERQVAYMASSYLTARVPELAVLDVPFGVRDRDDALRALDGHAGVLLRQAVGRRTGFHVLAFWDNGARHISNSVRPLRCPGDCTGLVIRTLDNEHYRATLAALAFQPVTTDVKELRLAVASGAVQAQENPLANFTSFELWRHHRHVSLTGHLRGVLLLVCPKPWFDALAPGVRAALAQAVQAATLQQRRRASEEDQRALDCLREQDVAVLQPAQIDMAAFREATAAVAERICRGLPAALVSAYLRPGVARQCAPEAAMPRT